MSAELSGKCCPTDRTAVTSDYVPQGKTIKAGEGENKSEVDVYVASGGEAVTVHNYAMVVCYDIFGVHAATQQFCDKLSEVTGALVVMPDFFRGEPWPLDKFPPADFKDLTDWVAKAGSWPMVKSDLDKVLPMFGADVKRWACLGFCWGGKISSHVVRDDVERFFAAACAHPAFLSADDARLAKLPWCVVPSKDEPPMDDFAAALDANKDVDTYFERYDDMHHGFCSARSDWSVPEQAQRATEALNLFANFFKKHAPPQN
jgi:dienelactone hydrolase